MASTPAAKRVVKKSTRAWFRAVRLDDEDVEHDVRKQRRKAHILSSRSVAVHRYDKGGQGKERKDKKQTALCRGHPIRVLIWVDLLSNAMLACHSPVQLRDDEALIQYALIEAFFFGNAIWILRTRLHQRRGHSIGQGRSVLGQTNNRAHV
jgi:hypothetical protein